MMSNRLFAQLEQPLLIESAWCNSIFSYRVCQNPNKENHLFFIATIMSVNKMPGRMIVKHRDIQNITGMTYRTASRMMKKVRQAYNKSNDQPITIDEFCSFFGLKEEKVREYIFS
jgi:hypothetical protein